MHQINADAPMLMHCISINAIYHNSVCAFHIPCSLLMWLKIRSPPCNTRIFDKIGHRRGKLGLTRT